MLGGDVMSFLRWQVAFTTMAGYSETSDLKRNKGADLPLHVEQSLLKTLHSKRRRQSVLQALVVLWTLYFVFSDPGALYRRYTGSSHPIETPNASLRNPSYLIEAMNGAVASENKRCSEIGVNIMKDGGNAVDAAIATLFCTGVVNMFSYALRVSLCTLDTQANAKP